MSGTLFRLLRGWVRRLLLSLAFSRLASLANEASIACTPTRELTSFSYDADEVNGNVRAWEIETHVSVENEVAISAAKHPFFLCLA